MAMGVEVAKGTKKVQKAGNQSSFAAFVKPFPAMSSLFQYLFQPFLHTHKYTVAPLSKLGERSRIEVRN